MPATMIDPEQLVAAVAGHFAVSTKVLTSGVRGNYRKRDPIMLLALALRQHTGMSYPEIADFMGRKSHTGVIYLVGLAGEQVKHDPDLARIYKAIVREAAKCG